MKSLAEMEREIAAMRAEVVTWLRGQFDGLSRADAEDIYQTACLRAVGALRRGDFAGHSSLSTWFHVIARNSATDRLRSAEARCESLDVLEANGNDEDGARTWTEPAFGADCYRIFQPIPPPYAALQAEEHAESVRITIGKMLDSLSDKSRAVVERFYLRGQTSHEIATALGIPKMTVLTRLHCARNQLRRRFATVARTLLLLVALPAHGTLFLRIDGGAEQFVSVDTNRLPASVAAPLIDQLSASGYAPFRPSPRPSDTWCTTWTRTIELKNGVWHEGWEESPVPVPVDRERIVAALVELPNGEELLSAALQSEAIAAWFTGDPVYVRGSQGAMAIAGALGISAVDLEALVRTAETNATTPR